MIIEVTQEHCPIQHDHTNLWLEAGSVWQVATPTNMPNPIPAPTPFFTDLSMNMIFNDSNGPRQVELTNVELVEYYPYFMPGRNIEKVAAEGKDAVDLLSLVQFEQPYIPGGIPAAMVTGRLKIIFNSGTNQETREFNVYNYRLIQDLSSPDTFYHCTSGFQSAILNMI